MSRSFDNPINWSFRIGRLFGIDIRVHLLFVLGAFVLLARAFQENVEGGVSTVRDSLIAIALLFLIVLIHEFGHCFGCRAVKGDASEIMLWPLGGLALVGPPHTPRAHLITALSGPAVHPVLCVLAAAVLVLSTGTFASVPWNPFRPFDPIGGLGVLHAQWQWWIAYFFGLNLCLLLFNLSPVFPLDGGKVLQSLLWPSMGFRDSMMLASGIGMIGAIGFAVIGIFSQAYILFALAFFGYVTCMQQRQQIRMGMYDEGGEFGYDFSQGYTSFERSAERAGRSPSYWQRRRARKEEARRQREIERLEADRRAVDAILEKISREGMQSLTPRERRILQRETQRQSSRDGH